MTAFPDTLPRPRTPDPRSAPSLRWGVMGTGWIAERFVASLKAHSSQQVVAIGSRNHETAARFAGRFAIPRSYSTYQDLVADPDIDVIYVATPHTGHLDGALLALAAGKHTLVEKPFAINANEARQIADVARARDLFCMEAHWTTFLPKYDVLQQLLDARVLGQLITIVADFGEWFPPRHRIFRPDLAGGPMLDLGLYLVSFVVNIFGDFPDQVTARSVPIDTGVQGQTAMIMSHGNRQAVLHTTILTNTPTSATIAGTNATISIDGPFYQPGGFTLTSIDGARSLRYDEPQSAHQGGLHYQAAEVARRITAGDTESPLRPLNLSIQTIAVLDQIRRETNDSFPDEHPQI
jgi:predicted dehydrogenase